MKWVGGGDASFEDCMKETSGPFQVRGGPLNCCKNTKTMVLNLS
ncbi:hypothetical protein SAMN05192544_1001317 [Paraburkholderia hospita]|nr:hypothetical protein SAMN05192544_1001317 [Paraburkholderia hospita]